MVRSEAQRTLIKSPLELWEELSDPASLARHLGEFGEISITRTQEDRTLEWEADSLSGTIELQPSGWGTRVTLTVAALEPQDADRAPPGGHPEPAHHSSETHRAPADQAGAREPSSAAGDTEDAPAGTETSTQSCPQTEEEEEKKKKKKSRWRDFFARLFRGRSRKRGLDEAVEAPSQLAEPEPTPHREPELRTEPEPHREPESHTEPEPHREPESTAEPEPTAGPELPQTWLEEIEAESADGPEDRPDGTPGRSQAEMTDEQAETILVALLDRLGAAHHRPYSRT